MILNLDHITYEQRKKFLINRGYFIHELELPGRIHGLAFPEKVNNYKSNVVLAIREEIPPIDKFNTIGANLMHHSFNINAVFNGEINWIIKEIIEKELNK